MTPDEATRKILADMVERGGTVAFTRNYLDKMRDDGLIEYSGFYKDHIGLRVTEKGTKWLKN